MTALAGYALAQWAAENNVKVILNGQGADEIFAGYPPAFAYYWKDLLLRGRVTTMLKEMGRYRAKHRSPWHHLIGRVAGLVNYELLRNSRTYKKRNATRQITNILENPWYTNDFKHHVANVAQTSEHRTLNQYLRRAVIKRPLPLYLRVEDRNAMAHSVEVRVPFLDYRIVELAFKLAGTEKISGPYNKSILRRAMKSRIPEIVRTRIDKMGFPMPVDTWIRGPLFEQMKDILSKRSLSERGIYDVKAILRDLDRHRRGTLNIANELFNVAQFEIWNDVRQNSPSM